MVFELDMAFVQKVKIRMVKGYCQNVESLRFVRAISFGFVVRPLVLGKKTIHETTPNNTNKSPKPTRVLALSRNLGEDEKV